MTESAFSLGSNLGDRLGFLKEAVRLLCVDPGVKLLARSPVYETEPVGVKPEYHHLAYLNAIVVVKSHHSAREWLEHIGVVETALGRVREADRFAPRTVDIDLIYHGREMLDSDALSVPHPRWAARRFVVQPLCDVRPDLILPGVSKTVREILCALPLAEKITLFQRTW